MRILLLAASIGVISGVASTAYAGAPDPTLPPPVAATSADVVAPAAVAHDIRQEIPLLAYTTSAFGAPAMTMGGLGYGGVLGGGGGTAGLRAGGGGRIWGSPVDRLTILVDVSRPLDDKDKSAKPSASVLFRFFGSQAKGYAMSAGLTYRTDGFADFGGEMEGTLLFSLARGRLHADANATFGGAVTDENEADGEAKLRVGYDVTEWLRVGVDGRFRYRLAGATSLPGNRLGDAVGGPELLFSYKHFFFSADGGPSTVGVVKGIGGTVVGTVGAAVW